MIFSVINDIHGINSLKVLIIPESQVFDHEIYREAQINIEREYKIPQSNQLRRKLFDRPDHIH